MLHWSDRQEEFLRRVPILPILPILSILHQGILSILHQGITIVVASYRHRTRFPSS